MKSLITFTTLLMTTLANASSSGCIILLLDEPKAPKALDD